VINKFVAVI